MEYGVIAGAVARRDGEAARARADGEQHQKRTRYGGLLEDTGSSAFSSGQEH